MNKTLRKIVLPALSIGIAGLSAVLFLSVSSLKDPETEFSEIRAELAAAEDRINSAVNVSSRPGLGPQNVAADESYAAALSYYATEDYPATIAMLNNYLNESQVPEFSKFQKAQYMLGRSYEDLGRKDKSLRAYLRYIAAFLTAKNVDHNEFLDVLRRTVAISIDVDEQSADARTLIASLTSLELPAEVKNVVNLIAAKSAVVSGNENVASRLLEETIKNSGDPTLKAKAYYVKSLLAISQKNYPAAEEFLALATTADVDSDTRDLARLGLARLAVKREKPTTALKYYGLIDEKSDQFRAALFESIFVHINIGEDAQARARALLFLSRFKDRIEAVQLKMILAYLDLKAGDYSAAKVTLESADQRVKDVDHYLYKNLVFKTNITASDLNTLSGLTDGHVDDAPAIKEASKVFSTLAIMQKTLFDIDGEIRAITFASSQSGLEQLNPTWVNRSEQLADIGDGLLAIGHRLIATERHLYDQDIDALNKQKLLSSENRRTKLLGQNISLKRKHINWKHYRDYLAVHMTIKDSAIKLASAEADLASLRLAKHNEKLNLSGVEVENLTKKLAGMRASHSELTRRSGLSKLKYTGKEGPHHGARLFLSQYVASLEEESQLIESAREVQNTTAVRLLASDAKEYWRLWRYTVGKVLQAFTALDQEINSSLEKSVNKLESLSNQEHVLAFRLSAIVNAVETGLGANLTSILSQYSIELNKKSARNKKWKADIDWLDYQQKQTEELALNEKYSLEQQILIENLRDIKQGLIW